MNSILVVDDEKDIRELVGDILRDEGHEVRLAWNGESTLKELNDAPPDLIILDIWLGMAISKLRSRRSSRVLMTSSKSRSILISCWW